MTTAQRHPPPPTDRSNKMLRIEWLHEQVSALSAELTTSLSEFCAAAEARIFVRAETVKDIAGLDEPLTLASYDRARDAALDATAVYREWQLLIDAVNRGVKMERAKFAERIEPSTKVIYAMNARLSRLKGYVEAIS